ncbi:MAG: thioredoxin family protein [Coriobacteriia bacterium]|nr:thioredoxin family protein [Coriobacteriia bacterium]
MAPVVDRLETRYETKVEVRRLNVDKDEAAAALASGFRIQYVPTFVFVNADGTMSETLVGEVAEGELVRALDALQ